MKDINKTDSLFSYCIETSSTYALASEAEETEGTEAFLFIKYCIQICNQHCYAICLLSRHCQCISSHHCFSCNRWFRNLWKYLTWFNCLAMNHFKIREVSNRFQYFKDKQYSVWLSTGCHFLIWKKDCSTKHNIFEVGYFIETNNLL